MYREYCGAASYRQGTRASLQNRPEVNLGTFARLTGKVFTAFLFFAGFPPKKKETGNYFFSVRGFESKCEGCGVFFGGV